MSTIATFTSVIQKDSEKISWTCVVWPESVSYLKTGRAVKVLASINGHEFQATFLPWGDGSHMLPLRAAVMQKINQKPGDKVEVVVKSKV